MFCFIIKITDINLAMRIDNLNHWMPADWFICVYNIFCWNFQNASVQSCWCKSLKRFKDKLILLRYTSTMVDNSAAEVKLVMLILWSLLRLYGRVINDCDDPAANPPLHRSVQVWLFLTWWLFFTCKHACLNYQV